MHNNIFDWLIYFVALAPRLLNWMLRPQRGTSPQLSPRCSLERRLGSRVSFGRPLGCPMKAICWSRSWLWLYALDCERVWAGIWWRCLWIAWRTGRRDFRRGLDLRWPPHPPSLCYRCWSVPGDLPPSSPSRVKSTRAGWQSPRCSLYLWRRFLRGWSQAPRAIVECIAPHRLKQTHRASSSPQ